MSAGPRVTPVVWLWNVTDGATPLAARDQEVVHGGRGAEPPATDVDLPDGWRLARLARLPACDTLSCSTRSLMGALTWSEQPLTLAR